MIYNEFGHLEELDNLWDVAHVCFPVCCGARQQAVCDMGAQRPSVFLNVLYKCFLFNLTVLLL